MLPRGLLAIATFAGVAVGISLVGGLIMFFWLGVFGLDYPPKGIQRLFGITWAFAIIIIGTKMALQAMEPKADETSYGTEGEQSALKKDLWGNPKDFIIRL